MRFLAPLLRRVLAVVVAGALLCGFVFAEVFAPAAPLDGALVATFAAALLAELGLVAAALARASGPLRRAAAAGWELPAADATRAAYTAHRLPAIAAAV